MTTISRHLGAVPEAAIAGLAREAEARHLELSVHDDYDIIDLPNGKIDARIGTQKSNPGKTLGKRYPPGEYGLYVLQFAGLIRKEWLNRLRAFDIIPVQYVPLNAFIVAGTPESLARAADLDFVQFIDIDQPFLKVAWLPDSETADAYVEMSTAPGSEALLEMLRKRSTTAIATESLGPLLQRVRGRFKTADRDVLLAEPLVIAIYEVPHDALSDERVALAVAGKIGIDGLPQDPKSYKTWLANMCEYCGNLQNDGFWIGFADTGLDSGNGTEGRGNSHHPDLAASPVFYATDFDNGHPFAPSLDTHDLSDSISHGTMVAGVAAGNPAAGSATDSDGYYYGSGLAPTAGLLITKNYQTSSQDFAVIPISTLARDTRNPSSRTNGTGPIAYVQNHSHNQYNEAGGCSNNYDGVYSSQSRDAVVGATTPLVNDLNLVVDIGVSCTQRFLGNLMTNDESTPFACNQANYDTANNVEEVIFSPAAVSGNQFVVTIKAATGNSSGQPYALVVNNAYPTSGVAPPSTPSTFTATATTRTHVDLSWPATGATSYDVQRSSDGSAFATIGSSTTNSYGDTVAANKCYVYRVRGRNSSFVSNWSPRDIATAVLFTDGTIAAQSTVIKAAHLTELRNAVNLVRAAAGLDGFVFTDPSITAQVSTIRATHVIELRSALDVARTKLELPPISYGNPLLTVGVAAVRAADVLEVRSGVQ